MANYSFAAFLFTIYFLEDGILHFSCFYVKIRKVTSFLSFFNKFRESP